MNTTAIIRNLCSARGISVTELEKELGFSNGSLTKNNYIRSDRLQILANYFNVSMEYLMTGKIPSLKKPENPPVNEKATQLYSLYEKASPEIQEAINLLLKSSQ